jgi:hypothetical protein
MEKAKALKRSKLWEQIYEIVKTLPITDCNEDCADASSVSTELEKLFLTLKHENCDCEKTHKVVTGFFGK